MKQKKLINSIEVPLAAMCFTPGCGGFKELTGRESKEETKKIKCPNCGKIMEVWGVEMSLVSTPNGGK